MAAVFQDVIKPKTLEMPSDRFFITRKSFPRAGEAMLCSIFPQLSNARNRESLSAHAEPQELLEADDSFWNFRSSFSCVAYISKTKGDRGKPIASECFSRGADSRHMAKNRIAIWAEKPLLFCFALCLIHGVYSELRTLRTYYNNLLPYLMNSRKPQYPSSGADEINPMSKKMLHLCSRA